MDRIPFDPQHLEAACRVLAAAHRGLTGPEIGREMLQEIRVADLSPDMTKWKRLYNALATNSSKQVSGGQPSDHADNPCHEPRQLRSGP